MQNNIKLINTIWNLSKNCSYSESKIETDLDQVDTKYDLLFKEIENKNLKKLKVNFLYYNSKLKLFIFITEDEKETIRLYKKEYNKTWLVLKPS